MKGFFNERGQWIKIVLAVIAVGLVVYDTYLLQLIAFK